MARFASLLPDDDDDCVSPEAEELLQRIEDMQNSDDYLWAQDTLEGIHDTVSMSGRVTEGQVRAIDNIENRKSSVACSRLPSSAA
jgi:hypothetical protein